MYRKEYMKERRQRPDIKKRNAEAQRRHLQNPDNRKKQRIRARKYAWSKRVVDPFSHIELLRTNSKLCAICSVVLTDRGPTRKVVDHCHSSRKLREVLCIKCNSLIGLAGDDVSILRKSINYLLKHR